LAVPWIVLVLALTYFTTGHIASNDQETHRLDAIAALPPALGLLLGVVIVVCGWARRPIEWVCLLLGCLGCGVMLFSFGWEFFH
jgi:hypothetical protein